MITGLEIENGGNPRQSRDHPNEKNRERGGNVIQAECVLRLGLELLSLNEHGGGVCGVINNHALAHDHKRGGGHGCLENAAAAYATALRRRVVLLVQIYLNCLGGGDCLCANTARVCCTDTISFDDLLVAVVAFFFVRIIKKRGLLLLLVRQLLLLLLLLLFRRERLFCVVTNGRVAQLFDRGDFGVAIGQRVRVVLSILLNGL